MASQELAYPEQPRGGPSITDRIARSIKSTDATLLIRIMSIINIVDALALAALFPYGYAIKEVEYNFNRGFLSAYCVVFALLLLAFELRVKAITSRLRRNFGFLFSFSGRTLFVIFLGSLAMSSKWLVGYVVGGITLANSLFNCYVIYTHPAFQDGGVLSPLGVSGVDAPTVDPNVDTTQRAVASSSYEAPQPSYADPFAGHASVMAPPRPEPGSFAYAEATAPPARSGKGEDFDNPFL